jgi:hypothetical protein
MEFFFFFCAVVEQSQSEMTVCSESCAVTGWPQSERVSAAAGLG